MSNRMKSGDLEDKCLKIFEMSEAYALDMLGQDKEKLKTQELKLGNGAVSLADGNLLHINLLNKEISIIKDYKTLEFKIIEHLPSDSIKNLATVDITGDCENEITVGRTLSEKNMVIAVIDSAIELMKKEYKNSPLYVQPQKIKIAELSKRQKETNSIIKPK